MTQETIDEVNDAVEESNFYEIQEKIDKIIKLGGTPSKVQTDKLKEEYKKLKSIIKIPTQKEIKKIIENRDSDYHLYWEFMCYIEDYMDFMPGSILLYLLVDDTENIEPLFKNYLLSIIYASQNIRELGNHLHKIKSEVTKSFKNNNYLVIRFDYRQEYNIYIGNPNEKELIKLMSELLKYQYEDPNIESIPPFAFVADISKKPAKKSQNIIIDSWHLVN